MKRQARVKDGLKLAYKCATLEPPRAGTRGRGVSPVLYPLIIFGHSKFTYEDEMEKE